ncbi:MAG: hypothetical protein ABSD38_38100, partial [Syntrophorhabdales bacterium]
MIHRERCYLSSTFLIALAVNEPVIQAVEIVRVPLPTRYQDPKSPGRPVLNISVRQDPQLTLPVVRV